MKENFKEITISNTKLLIGDNGTVINYITNKEIKQHSVGGYLVVNVPTKPKRKQMYVHRLVAIAFLNNGIDFEDTVNHKDYNKTNNNINNLEIIPRELNASDSYNQINHGNVGENNKNSKLTVNDVIKIKSMLNDYNDYELSKIFNVSKTTIYDIRKGRTWKRIK